MASQEENKLFISNNYPHSLMLHVSGMLREKGLNSLEELLEGGGLEEFCQKYSSYPAEVKELQIAQEDKIISGFVENKKAPAWRKRAFINASLVKLVKRLKEYEAVELMESLMHLFHWEMEFAAPRKWEVSEEDRATFHNFDKPAGSGDKSFEQKAKEHIEESKEKQIRMRRRKLRETEVQEDSLPKRGKRTRPGRRAVRENTAEKKREIGTGSDAVSRTEVVVPEYLLIEELSEEEYRKKLAEIEIKHEALMTMAVRREIGRAKRGNATSQCILGSFYAEEHTEHTDYEFAVKWYAFAARQGSFKAKLEMGRIFDSEKLGGSDIKRYGIRYFQELAEEGYPTAQCIMGLKYYFGDGVDKNISKGVKWLKKAGKQGYVEAQRQLGDIYAIADEEEAAKWYEMAEQNGDLLAGKKRKALKGE